MESGKFKLKDDGNALRQVREALKMSQEEFAYVLKATRRSISRWENGTTVPMFTLPQIKALQQQLRKLELDFEDIPDDWNVKIKEKAKVLENY